MLTTPACELRCLVHLLTSGCGTAAPCISWPQPRTGPGCHCSPARLLTNDPRQLCRGRRWASAPSLHPRQLATKFRLGGLTDVRGVIPVEDLKMLSTNGTGLPARELPESVRRITGDIIVALSDGDFISFAARRGDKALVAIKNDRLWPLTLPNVARNVIAHELGHAIGLPHNDDPTMLMCGRPAPCRPDLVASEVERYFPLSELDKGNLRRMYPPNWRAAQQSN